MAKVSVFDMTGQQVSEIELADAVFGITPNESAMHAMVVNYLANQRQGTQSTLTRSEVRGGGRKPWRQKGTGHARQGSIRAPQWTHGGIALGPKPRDYRYALNKKLRKARNEVRTFYKGSGQQPDRCRQPDYRQLQDQDRCCNAEGSERGRQGNARNR